MKTTPEDRIAAYKAAYLAANGCEIEVSYAHGYYYIAGRFKSAHRGAQIDEFTARLKARPSTPVDAGRDEGG